jgi:hypothetical protein
VFGADGIGRRHGVIRELVVLGDLADEFHAALVVRKFLAKEAMEDGARGVKGLELILDVEGLEDIFGEADRKVRGVGVERNLLIAGGGDDIWVSLLVVLGKTEGGGFGWGGFEVIEVAIELLIVGEAGSHMVEDFNGEGLSGFVGEVFFDPTGIEAGFIHTNETDGGEVVVEGAEVMLGVWI